MIFPNPKFRLQRHLSTFKNNQRTYNRLWYFGYLNPAEKTKSANPCLWINKECSVRNFEWQGSMGGIHISSNRWDSASLRLPSSKIKVKISNFFCEDVGESALNIFSGASVHAVNCAFRGNYKLNPLVEKGVGQNNLVTINGGSALFENCLFFNSMVPIIAKANSRVTFKNCGFSVCKTAVGIDGADNPRKNDIYFGGEAGESHVSFIDCETFKVETLAFVERGGKFSTNVEGKVILDGGEKEWLS